MEVLDVAVTSIHQIEDVERKTRVLAEAHLIHRGVVIVTQARLSLNYAVRNFPTSSRRSRSG